MPFKARFKGTCAKCGKSIEPGQEIAWSRLERKSWHVACDTPKPTASPVAGLTLDALKALLASLESRVPAPIEDSEPSKDSEPTASEMAELTDHTPFVPETSTPKPHTSVTARNAPKPVRVTELSKFKANSKWYDTLVGILPYASRILLIGPPSTGKSTTALLTAGCQHRVTMTETTSREELLGMFQLIDGNTKWVDGPITSAMRNGQPVLIDEIDRYSPEAASLLYALIDDKPHVTLANGEAVSAQPGYKMIMTSNEGLDALPVAVQDRIEVILSASEPHTDALADLPSAFQAVACAWYRTQPQAVVKLPPTVRRMRMYHRLTDARMNVNLAAKLVFGKEGASEVLSVLTSAEAK